MSKWIGHVITIMLSFLVSIASAVEVTCLSTEDGTFVRGPGGPVTETVTFPGVVGPALLKMYNGADDDSYEKVSSSIISVNGVDVATPDVFNHNIEYGMLQRTVILGEPSTSEFGYNRIDRFTNISNTTIRLDSVKFLYLDPDDVGIPNITRDNWSEIFIAAGNIYPEFSWWGGDAWYKGKPLPFEPFEEYPCSNPNDPIFDLYVYATTCGDPDTVNWTNSMMVKDLGNIILEPFEYIDISHTAINDIEPEITNKSYLVEHSELVIGFKFYQQFPHRLYVSEITE
jgi:hypothetical protein